MLAWIAHCFANYAVFKGRASRPEYWWFWLFGTVTSLAIIWLAAPPSLPGIGFIKYVWSAILFLPSLAVASRRLHDTGHSLWWAVTPYVFLAPIVVLGLTQPGWIKGRAGLGLLPFLGLLASAIWLLVLYCRKGDAGPNRYGDPAPTTPS